MSKLNTTTYRNRRPGRFLELAELTGDIDSPVVIDIGPGGVIKGFEPLIRPGSPIRFVAKLIESLLRRLPFLPLESFEPFEIYQAFEQRDPKMFAVDIHPRIADNVTRQSGGRIQGLVHNLAKGPIPNPGDVVICCAVFPNNEGTMQDMAHNIVRSVKPGGFLFLPPPSYKPLMENEPVKVVGDGVYQRLPE